MNQTNMKHSILTYIILFLTFSCTMPKKMPADYASRWKRVDELINQQGLTRSAMTEIRGIYDLAKKDNQPAQAMKALLYLSEELDQVSENAQTEALEMMEKELSTAVTPDRELLHSMLAGKYKQILDNNRWELMNRTPTGSVDPKDWKTWSSKDFHRVIGEHYLASLEDPDALKATGLRDYGPVILRGNAPALRPSLYDLLAHQALSYFKNDERDIADPVNVFKVNDPAVLADARTFSQAEIRTTDSSSLYYRAVRIYQDLLAFHLNDTDPSALLDVDLERLDFMQQASVLQDKEERYLQAMDRIANSHPTHEAGALAKVKTLNARKDRLESYDPVTGPEADRLGLVELERSYREVMNRFPGTAAGAQARRQWASITDSSLSVITEQVNLSGKPFLALVNFRNINAFRYRIIAMDMDNPVVQRTEKFWDELTGRQAIKEVSVSLPDPGDRREHRVEIGIEGLPIGRYAILASVAPGFSTRGNPLSVQYFHVSGISFIKKDDAYFFLDRETGKPLGGAVARLVQYRYEGSNKAPGYTEIRSATANGDGYAKLSMQGYGSSMTDVRWGNDRLFTDDQEYHYDRRPVQEDVSQLSGALFTDRAIYRPGQPLYVKAILVNRDPMKKNHTVAAGRDITVELRDANGEKVSSLSLRSNAYGSVNGIFRIPEGRLNGQYSLTVNGTDITAYVRVEEYKRPGFEVMFEPVREAFRLNEDVKVQGSVAGYAGNLLNDAVVSYRVVRTVRLPWWGGYGRFPRRQSAEITNGTLKTDEEGKFEITFRAIPDLSVDRRSEPTFDYMVYVDATDNSGETRSGEKQVSIGYKAMSISLAVNEEKTYADTLSMLPVSIRNLAGEPLSSDLKLEIRQLETPQRLIRKRYWEAPDLAVMTREEFIRSFPYDEYLTETDPLKWKVVSSSTVEFRQVKDGGSVRFRTLAPGTYRMIATGKDRYGEEARDEQIITVRNTRDWTKNIPAYTLTPQGRVSAEPGMPVKLQMGSSAEDLTLVRSIVNGSGEAAPVLVTNPAGMMSMDIRPTEADRGGIQVHHAFVRHNRFHSISQMVDVPWSNKELTLTTETFRDKLLPGAKETWKVRIRGAKGDKFAAELLTSMYDASLDQFTPHGWVFPNLFRRVEPVYWDGRSNFREGEPMEAYDRDPHPQSIPATEPDRLYWAVERPWGGSIRYKLAGKANGVMMNAPAIIQADSAKAEDMVAFTPPAILPYEEPKEKAKASAQEPGPRKNFTETAFFLPDLSTDKDGQVEFSFTLPESLTRWKWMSFAHTKDLATGMMVKEIVAQKQLMVQPNMPRFLREGDRITLSARVSNLTDKAVTGQATLQLIDPETNAPVDGLFSNAFASQYFTAEARQTSAVAFDVVVPARYTKPLQYRIMARAGNNSDGEENIIPVLTDRILVTESLPLLMLGGGTKTFTFDRLLNNKSGTLSHHSLTTEYSTNPAWYAVLSLPYVMEYPYECAEQTFSRLYANALAAQVTNHSPAIRSMFETWKTTDTAALISNLMKNPELKQVLLENTPWVLEARSESQQRRNIAMLFEAGRLEAEMRKNIARLSDMQLQEGAFPWFKGGMANRYITQYIVTGIARLEVLSALPEDLRPSLEEIRQKATAYLDRKLLEDHTDLIRQKADLSKQQISPLQVQYLYMRSYSGEKPKETRAYEYYLSQARQYWLKLDRQSQGMLALVFHRLGDKPMATTIMKSLKENAITDPSLGMYWKETVRGYYWYQAPVETQSLLIEAFDEVTADKPAVEQMKLWLLNQKRVQSWESTKATADAVYALLRKGGNWLSATPTASIRLGDQPLETGGAEAGTGYTRQVIPGAKVRNEMGNVSVNIKGAGEPGLSWGAVHWQYFEDMDKVTASATPLQLSKQFQVERKTAAGPVLEEIREGQPLRVGDKLVVRVVLKADRDMEFIHMKDMRASGTEPANVLSGYRWQGGLGYYEATRDASTDFFFDWLPKGTWVFEYPLFVTHAGQFTAGISTIQSMYAPEFNAHSAGRKIAAGPRE
jgi:hypothetical protein